MKLRKSEVTPGEMKAAIESLQPNQLQNLVYTIAQQLWLCEQRNPDDAKTGRWVFSSDTEWTQGTVEQIHEVLCASGLDPKDIRKRNSKPNLSKLIQDGTQAWKDIPSGSDWVEKERGNLHE